MTDAAERIMNMTVIRVRRIVRAERALISQDLVRRAGRMHMIRLTAIQPQQMMDAAERIMNIHAIRAHRFVTAVHVVHRQETAVAGIMKRRAIQNRFMEMTGVAEQEEQDTHMLVRAVRVA